MKKDADNRRPAAVPGCGKIREAMLLEMDGEALAPAAKRHLEECPACREFREFATGGMPAAAADVVIPPDLDAKILARARKKCPSPARAARILPLPMIFRLAAAAALVAMLMPAALRWFPRHGDGDAPLVAADENPWRDQTIVDDLAATTATLEMYGLDDPAAAAGDEIEQDLYALQAEIYFLAAALD